MMEVKEEGIIEQYWATIHEVVDHELKHLLPNNNDVWWWSVDAEFIYTYTVVVGCRVP